MTPSQPQPVAIRPAGVEWELVCTQHVPYPLDDVFNFFASVRNLDHICRFSGSPRIFDGFRSECTSMGNLG